MMSISGRRVIPISKGGKRWTRVSLVLGFALLGLVGLHAQLQIPRIGGGAGDYRVGHLPMLEQKRTFVWCGPDDTLWQALVQAVEEGMPRNSLQRVSINDTTKLEEAARTEGARFFLIDTSQIGRLMWQRLRECLGERLEMTHLPKGRAGYRVVWYWKKGLHPDQMWVIIYAPGAYSLKRAIARACQAVGWHYKKPLEPVEEWTVEEWVAVVEPAVAKVPDIQKWLEEQIAKREQEVDWEQITPSEVFEKAARLSRSHQLYLLSHSTISQLPLSARLHLGSLFEPLSKLKPNEMGMFTYVKEGGYKVICYAASAPGLWATLIQKYPDFGNLQPSMQEVLEVPDLQWVKKVALILKMETEPPIPKGALQRFLAELKNAFPNWRIYDRNSLPSLERLQGATLQGLPSNPSKQEVLEVTQNADAVLLVSITRCQRKAEWKFTPLRAVGGTLIPEADQEEPYTEPDKLQLPVGLLSSRMETDKEYEKRLRRWVKQHQEWRKRVLQLETQIESQTHLVSREAFWEERVEIELELVMLDLRSDSAQFGLPIPETRVAKVIGTGTASLRKVVQSGHARARVLNRPSGKSRFERFGESYLGIRLEVLFEEPDFAPLPTIPFMPESRAWLEASANLAKTSARQLSGQVLYR